MPKLPSTSDMFKTMASTANTSGRKVWQTIRPDQALSWQTLLFLCLFSWVMALLTSDSPLIQSDVPIGDLSRLSLSSSPTKYALFTMGWIFLTLAIAWLLHGSRWKIPLFDVGLRPAAWVSAAVACAFAFQVWYDENIQTALIAWPIVAAVFYAFPRCMSSRSGYKKPKVPERQHLLIIALVSLLISCWIQFYFLVQDWVEGYTRAFDPLLPGIELDGGDRDTDVDTINPDANTPDANTGATIDTVPADIAESVVANELEAFPVPEIRQLLSGNQALVEELNAQFDRALVSAGESPDWALQIAQISPSPLSFQLQVLPPFTATSAEDPSNVTRPIYKACRVSATDTLSADQLSQIECSAATLTPEP